MDQTHRFSAWAKASAKPVIALAACMAMGALAPNTRAADDKADAGKAISFSKDIQPLFKDNCVKCHKPPEARGPGGPGGGAGEGGAGGGGGGGGQRGRRGPMGPAGGLRLDDEAAAMKGGRHGKAIVPGKAEDSLLYQVLKGPVQKGNDKINQMPKGRPNESAKPLTEDQIQLVKNWIDQGAKWDKQ